MKVMKKIIYLNITMIFCLSNIYAGGLMKKKQTRSEMIKSKIEHNPFIKLYNKKDNGLLTNEVDKIILYDKYIFFIYDILQYGKLGIFNKETEKLENLPVIKMLDDKIAEYKEKGIF